MGNGAFSKWSHWSKCSKRCGGGVQVKIRKCDHPKPKYGGKPCLGNRVAKKKCNMKPCAVNGAWGHWSKWGTCSKECGGGMKVRTRNCDDPKPKAGGKKCHGSRIHRAKCNMKACP